MKSAPQQHGVLLVGHGTREVAGQAEARQLHELVARQLPETPCELSFLELAEPNIADAIVCLLARGVMHLEIVPLLLFAAGHAKSDVPNAVAHALHGHPAVTWRQTPEFGQQPELLAISRDRFKQAIADDPSDDLSQTLLIMVGRGSGDTAAIDAMRHYARLHQAHVAVAACQVCFVALAEPLVDQFLPTLTQAAYRRIVVQPHLLFRGQLLDKLQSLVAHCAAQNPAQTWRVTEHLGADPGIARLILQSLKR
jgi:sirohydrochlorin cobaltochelatase